MAGDPALLARHAHADEEHVGSPVADGLDHGRGLAGYWRSVPLLDSPAGRAALRLDDTETPIGLLHLGRPRQEQRVPERAPVSAFARYLP